MLYFGEEVGGLVEIGVNDGKGFLFDLGLDLGAGGRKGKLKFLCNCSKHNYYR